MPEISIEQALGIAVRHHQAGRFSDADPLYRQILTLKPDHPDALHLLGVLAAQQGRADVAIDLIRRAVAILPGNADYHGNLANALRDAGRLEEAIGAYRRSLHLGPNSPDTHNNLGTALKEQGNLEEAIAAYHKALALAPNSPGILCNLGIALTENKCLDEAIAVYRRAIQLKPDYIAAYKNLGITLAEQGHVEEAIEIYQQALRIGDDADICCNLGNALGKKGEFDAAIDMHHRALRLKPDSVEVHYNLGVTLAKRKQFDESMVEFREALRLKPDYADAWYNLGIGFEETERFGEAISAYEQAIRFKPEWADPHWNLALNALLKGDFERGWQEYEWRWRWKDFTMRPPDYPQPLWQGQDLSGRTILLRFEQGFGDTIQFIRYAKLIGRQGGRIVLDCQPALARLLQGMPELAQVNAEPVPHFDFHCALMSLPHIFKTRRESIPDEVPYLKADVDLTATWSERLPQRIGRLRIGLAWAGHPTNKNDRHRSIRLAQLLPLAKVSGVTFFSLQKGKPAEQTAGPLGDMNLFDFTADLRDFADTAALIANLDLVITVDTAVVHLAAAMGKPVWLLLPSNPDWRWMLEGETTPWYPTMRLFRQKRRGDWDEVIERVVGELGAR